MENPHKVGERWYRVFTQKNSFARKGPSASPVVIRPEVVRVTNRCVYLSEGYAYPQRRVLIDSRKRWAYPTLEEAVASWLARTGHEVNHLIDRLQDVAAAVRLFDRERIVQDEQITHIEEWQKAKNTDSITSYLSHVLQLLDQNQVKSGVKEPSFLYYDW